MLTLSRQPGWAERLLALVESYRAKPFVWGEADCATFFAEAVQAVTGFHPLVGYMPYSSELGAMKMLAGSGYDDMLHFARCLFPEVAPSLARRGDIGFIADRERLTCPAVIVGHEAVSRNQAGWLMFPVASLATAFRIG